MNERTFKRLALHLDREACDFAPSTTGADVRLLQRLFTEPEAALALHVAFEQQDAQAIARRAGLPLAEVEERLAEMARKGLLYAVYPMDGPTRYQIPPFGFLWDAQAPDMTLDLIEARREHRSTQEARPRGKSIPGHSPSG